MPSSSLMTPLFAAASPRSLSWMSCVDAAMQNGMDKRARKGRRSMAGMRKGEDGGGDVRRPRCAARRDVSMWALVGASVSA